MKHWSIDFFNYEPDFWPDHFVSAQQTIYERTIDYFPFNNLAQRFFERHQDLLSNAQIRDGETSQTSGADKAEAKYLQFPRFDLSINGKHGYVFGFRINLCSWKRCKMWTYLRSPAGNYEFQEQQEFQASAVSLTDGALDYFGTRFAQFVSNTHVHGRKIEKSSNSRRTNLFTVGTNSRAAERFVEASGTIAFAKMLQDDVDQVEELCLDLVAAVLPQRRDGANSTIRRAATLEEHWAENPGNEQWMEVCSDERPREKRGKFVIRESSGKSRDRKIKVAGLVPLSDDAGLDKFNDVSAEILTYIIDR